MTKKYIMNQSEKPDFEIQYLSYFFQMSDGMLLLMTDNDFHSTMITIYQYGVYSQVNL